MKKTVKLLSIFIFFSFFLVSCSSATEKTQASTELQNKENPSTQAVITTEATTTAEDTMPAAEPLSPPDSFFDGYEEASYDKYNSPAEENGLGGALIHLTGVMGEIRTLTSKEYVFFQSTITTPDDNQWLVLLNNDLFSSEDYYVKAVGHTVAVCAIYDGFSESKKMPSISMVKLFDTVTGETLNGFGMLLLPEESQEESAPSVTTTEAQPTEDETSPENTSSADTGSGETSDQKNAVKRAQMYLRTAPFSYDGLVSQLEYEQFSHEDAVYGADHCGADWEEQALKSAVNYLNVSAFSYDGLVDQLEYCGFTHDQAVYGADSCNADWNEQAAKKAAVYIDTFSFSRDKVIKQLEYEGFTHEQAVYGADAN